VRYISKAVHTGRNAEEPRRRDDNYVQCSRCHFMCHTDRDMHAPNTKLGYGIVYTSTGTAGVDDPVVSNGCPQCGTYLYRRR